LDEDEILEPSHLYQFIEQWTGYRPDQPESFGSSCKTTTRLVTRVSMAREFTTSPNGATRSALRWSVRKIKPPVPNKNVQNFTYLTY
jgi:hypothetical protein